MIKHSTARRCAARTMGAGEIHDKRHGTYTKWKEDNNNNNSKQFLFCNGRGQRCTQTDYKTDTQNHIEEKEEEEVWRRRNERNRPSIQDSCLLQLHWRRTYHKKNIFFFRSSWFNACVSGVCLGFTGWNRLFCASMHTIKRALSFSVPHLTQHNFECNLHSLSRTFVTLFFSSPSHFRVSFTFNDDLVKRNLCPKVCSVIVCVCWWR